MLVHSGQCLTAGAALSHIGMALWLIRQASPYLAAVTARYLVVDTRTTQSAYAIMDHLEHFPIREAIPRVCKESFALFFGTSLRKESNRFPKRLNSTRLHFE